MGLPRAGGARTDLKACQSSAAPSRVSRNLSQASASQREPSPARSTLVLVVGLASHPHPRVLAHPHADGLPSRHLAPVTLSFQHGTSSSPLSLALSVPSSPSCRDQECGRRDLPELLLFGDQPPSAPWDSDADGVSATSFAPASIANTAPSPLSSSRARTTSPTIVNPPPKPHVSSTPYQVALAVEEGLMSNAVPPPSPPQPPKYVPKDPPTPSNPTVHGPYSAKTLQLIRDIHGGGVQYFVDGMLNRRAMYRFAVQRLKKNPLRVWQEGMRITRSQFLGRDEEHAAVVLEILCATPKHPRIRKPPPRRLPRPPPSPASDQVAMT